MEPKIEPRHIEIALMIEQFVRFNTGFSGKWVTPESVAAIIAGNLAERTPSSPAAPLALSTDQIKRMVERFLQWKLPENFNPDGGISFKKTFNEHTSHPMKHEPAGTNLFDFSQAEEMVRYMVESGSPLPPPREDHRCAVCGWSLVRGDGLKYLGCVRGNCSMRPFPQTFYDRNRAAIEYNKPEWKVPCTSSSPCGEIVAKGVCEISKIPHKRREHPWCGEWHATIRVCLGCGREEPV